MAGDGVARKRQQKVPGGRPYVHKVKLTERQEEKAQNLAAARNWEVARLLATAVEDALEGLPSLDRVEAVEKVLDLAWEVVRTGHNVNQIAKLGHTYKRPVPEAAEAVAAAGELFVTLNELARWVMGAPPVVSGRGDRAPEADSVPGEWGAVDGESEG